MKNNVSTILVLRLNQQKWYRGKNCIVEENDIVEPILFRTWHHSTPGFQGEVENSFNKSKEKIKKKKKMLYVGRLL